MATSSHYPSYEVLTDLRPCWVGREAYRLEPGWCYRTETRVISDDSLDGIGFGYCAVSDMRRAAAKRLGAEEVLSSTGRGLEEMPARREEV